MRITPTREQLAYLASIGVSEDTLAESVGGPAAAEAENFRRPDKPSGHGLGWVLVVLLAAVLVVLAFVSMARGVEPPQPAPAQPAFGNERADQRMQDFETWLRGPDSSASLLNDWPDRITVVPRARRGMEETEVRALVREELRAQADKTDYVTLPLTVVTGLLTVLVVVWRVVMDKRVRQLEMAFLAGTAGSPADGICEPTGNVRDRTPRSSPAAPRDGRYKPVRRLSGPLPNPREQMELIIRSAAKLKRFRVRLRLPEGPWTMGLATAKGNVRTENEDYALCFRMDDDHDVLTVADGCGGVPHGRRAAYVAVVSAAASVVRTYGTAPLLFTPRAREAAAQAIEDAARRLAVEGDKLNVTESRAGLRTTLIVLIGDRREIGYAYIGDGGGCVVRASGAIDRFLSPQKADELAMNVLAASLGPVVEGNPVTGTIKRMPGDLVLVGTDGVFDRIGPEFPKDVLRGCVQFGGDLQATAEHVLDELASFKDGEGYVCDDNMTLGLLGDGTSPRLPQGFWSAPPPQDAPAESTPEAVVEAAKEGAG